MMRDHLKPRKKPCEMTPQSVDNHVENFVP